MKNIEHAIQVFEAIAKRNHDEFRYRIGIELRAPHAGPRFEFVVEETADNHTFCSGWDNNPDAAARAAAKGALDACLSWGYIIPSALPPAP